MSDMDKNYLEEIKAAAKEGAKEGIKEAKLHRGGIGSGIASMFAVKLILILVIVAVIITAIYMLNPFPNVKEQLEQETSAIEHDLILEDQGILGYTAADFAEAVLGDETKLCKLEVLKQEVTDASTLIDTGLGNFKMFSKTQIITYHGTAIYTVDLSKLNNNSFELNDEEKELIIYIPHAEMEPINIQSEDIEFGDVNKGMLAFGEIKATPEEMAAVQTKAQSMMEEKIADQNIAEQADRFAKLVVWELFQPVVNGVTKGYSLVVEFE